MIDLVRQGVPGWRLSVLAPPGPLVESLPDESVCPVAFSLDMRIDQSVIAVRRAIEATRADVIHSHLARADVIAWLASGSVPHVATEHGIADIPSLYATSSTDFFVTTAVHRLRMRRMSAVVCVSEATAKVVKQRWRPPSSVPLVVIRNGIDRPPRPQEKTPRPSGTTIGYLGRFEQEKRPDLVLAAFARLLRDEPHARLSMAGGGSLWGTLQEKARSLGIADSVNFPGWVDSSDWLRGVDVLCVPSVWENCSYSILEALALGVGVVAAPVGGNPEILPTQSLADPTDIEAQVAAIRHQMRNRELRSTLDPGYPTVSQMTNQLAQVYEIASHKRPTPGQRWGSV